MTNLIYVIAVLLNACIISILTVCAYQSGVKDGKRRAVIEVCKTEGIITDDSPKQDLT